jgi:hypothetical protein
VFDHTTSDIEIPVVPRSRRRAKVTCSNLRRGDDNGAEPLAAVRCMYNVRVNTISRAEPAGKSSANAWLDVQLSCASDASNVERVCEISTVTSMPVVCACRRELK